MKAQRAIWYLLAQASFFCAVTMDTFAVMPGRNFKSELSTLMTVS